jgi:hypothetical protein
VCKKATAGSTSRMPELKKKKARSRFPQAAECSNSGLPQSLGHILGVRQLSLANNLNFVNWRRDLVSRHANTDAHDTGASPRVRTYRGFVFSTRRRRGSGATRAGLSVAIGDCCVRPSATCSEVPSNSRVRAGIWSVIGALDHPSNGACGCPSPPVCGSAPETTRDVTEASASNSSLTFREGLRARGRSRSPEL